jgi:hypothetical protein
MAKHRLNRPDAKLWFDKSFDWMDEHRPDDSLLRRFRADAAHLLESDPNEFSE